MERPNFEVIVDDKKNKRETYILIVDKKGIIGSALCKKLIESCFVVFVSHVFPKEINSSPEYYSFISYRNNIPEIPQGLYSHIFIVYNGEKEIKESFPDFLNHAKKTNAKLIIITSFLGNKKIEDWNLELNKNINFVFYGDLFDQVNGQNIEESDINKLLYLAKNKGRIVIRGLGFKKMYPVFFEDAITGILEAAFANNSESTFLLFPKYPPTMLSVAKMLYKIEPSLKIDFAGEDKNVDEKNYDASSGKYLLEKDYPLLDRLKLVYNNSISPFENENVNQGIKQQRQNLTFKNYLKPLIFSMAFLFLLFFIPFFITSFFSFLGLNSLKNAKNQFENGNFDKAIKNTKASENFFNLSSFTVKMTERELSLIGKEKYVISFGKSIKTGKEVSRGLIYGLDAWSNFSKVFNGESINSKNDFNNGLNSLQKTISFYQKTKAENNLIFKDSPFFSKDFNNGVSFITATKDLLPAILGFDREKKYLVLFQNNMELRSGGGFIGSYGILTFKNGKMQDFKIHDVYEADGQLKGHIEPPFPIRRYIPQVHLFLRDSNFNIDFLKGASISAQMLSKEINDVVDGVIAIDITFVKNLIGVLGKVYVSDYKEIVDKDNFYLLTQTHSEKDFFPGSSQKKNFLNSLFNAISNDTTSKKSISYPALLSLVGKSILEKHIIFAFSDPKVQEVFTINGFSSSILDKRQNERSQINDFLGINEMNLGVNKANYFLERKIKQEVSVNNEGMVNEKIIVTYKNNSQKNKWPGGDYKAYFRIILPQNTEILSIAVNNEEQKIVKAITDFTVYEKKNFKPPSGLEVERIDEHGKTTYGFLINVSLGESKEIAISYNLPNKVLLNQPVLKYNQIVFKQPGTESDPYFFSLSYPKSFKLLKASENGDLEELFKDEKEVVKLSTVLSQDLNLHIDFAKK